MKSLESLRKAKSRSIVVASDVAARGLDIPSVATVIHYDCARAVDTFIHRAGRTAVSFLKIVTSSFVYLNIRGGGDDLFWTRVSDVYMRGSSRICGKLSLGCLSHLIIEYLFQLVW